MNDHPNSTETAETPSPTPVAEVCTMDESIHSKYSSIIEATVQPSVLMQDSTDQDDLCHINNTVTISNNNNIGNIGAVDSPSRNTQSKKKNIIDSPSCNMCSRISSSEKKTK